TDCVATIVNGPIDDTRESVDIDRRLLTKALTIRQTENCLLQLSSQGKVSGRVHTCLGQEWIPVAVAESLRPGDYIFSNHRGHGHYLAWTDDVEGLVAEIMGKTDGPCAGRGGSQHLCRDGFFSSGTRGGIVPVAAGLAMAKRMAMGIGIAVVFIGDGMLAQGVVYETLNITAKWSLPLLIVLEDNGVAQTTDQSQTLAGTIKGRARALGIDMLQADTWHPSELIGRAAEAVQRVRMYHRPLLLNVKTYRLGEYSQRDDGRDYLEVVSFAERDTLNQLIQDNVPETQQILNSIDKRLAEAVRRAEAAEFASVEFESNLTSRDTDLSLQWKPVSFEARQVNQAIGAAISEAMARDDRIVLLGTDIRDPYGGEFKVTAGLSDKFGDRVRNMPINEAAMVGIGNGLALAGKRPVVEIMFGDSVTLAADQIVNHAAKFAWVYNRQVSVPIIIRTPMGGHRGEGPVHSQSLEKHLLGVPGLRVLAVHKRYCPQQLYRTLFNHNHCPTLLIENRQLYGQQTDPQPPAGLHLLATDTLFPTVRLAPREEPQLTVVAYGGMVDTVESAMAVLGDQHDCTTELVIPTQLYPLDIEPIVESVCRTGRLLVVEEGQGFAGLGSELIARLVADCRVTSIIADRVNARVCPVPASRPAEEQVLPGVDDIIAAAGELMARNNS
ncbi:MAG: dehydrogenase E1 component subunit alpha/beta, partial [Planctomycetota bacterium]